MRSNFLIKIQIKNSNHKFIIMHKIGNKKDNHKNIKPIQKKEFSEIMKFLIIHKGIYYRF